MSTNPVGLKKFYFFHVLIIATLAIGLYSNTLKNDFVYDDEFTITKNTLIKSFDNLPLLFDKTAYFGRSGELSYRPLVTLSYFIDFAVFGLKPWGFHLTNILLHAINGVLLYIFITLFLRYRTEPRPVFPFLTNKPLIISLLFISHPLLTEAVNGISFREDLLAFFFYMMTLILYAIKRSTVSSKGYMLYFFSFTTYLLSLLSKEMAVTAPLIIYIYEYCLMDKSNERNHIIIFSIGYIFVTFIYTYLQFYHFHSPKAEGFIPWELGDRLLTIPSLFLNYLSLAVFPISLSADYLILPIKSIFFPSFVFQILAILLLLLVIIFLWNREKAATFGTIYFIITLLPVFNIIPIANVFTERYLYIPLVGFVLVIGCAIDYIGKATKHNIIVFWLIVLICINIISVIRRNDVWKSDLSLWSNTVSTTPNSWRAHFNLGLAFQKQQKYDNAIHHYAVATTLNPDYLEAIVNLGVLYSMQGKHEASIKQFQTALILKPENPNFHFNLAKAYFYNGKIDESIRHFQNAIKLNPRFSEARNMLESIYSSELKENNDNVNWRVSLPSP